ncbi:type IIG restriction enzyme/methyltransferase [Spirosoma endbachense]|uniref:site-specific DNA-methyltransferase (adenine-specific) n=1 Tax=Spirosoma endbachense TaxID=2666025 RepID=A0A6P1VN70_9BACT|nr:class I SAM-dependent DNA methyltransferase [Spirosoma endbachense]QHV94533.1 class I SAM-dependent DNA methyltransferase [Spirosoma endbachense]
MRLHLRKPLQSLNKAYARQSVPQEQLDTFRSALTRLFSRVDEKESEEYQKNIVAEFLSEMFYGNTFDVHTNEWIDLVIQTGPVASETPDKLLPGSFPSSAIIETRKVFAAEMMTPLKNNVKALHELILYYFELRERDPDHVVCQLIITDVYNWFIFDETDFRQFFYDNARLKRLFQLRQQQKKDDAFFYTETARILRDLDVDVPVTYLNLREFADALKLPPEQGNRALMPVVKVFSPEHLLKQPLPNGTDAVSKRFYNELLYIVGLHELPTNKKGRLIQRLPENERAEGSLLENAISQLRKQNALVNVEGLATYGATETDQLVAIGLELCFTWLGRMLFIKLLDAQLVKYGLHDQSAHVLTAQRIHDFTALNALFFDVMAVPEERRSADSINRFGRVPYLACSLFDKTDLERQTVTIGDLDNTLELPIAGQTVLNNVQAGPEAAQRSTLHYLQNFLDAYDFSVDDPLVVQEDKPNITAAALGAIFEMINCYRTNSVLIPDHLVAEIVRNTVRRAVVSTFTTYPDLNSLRPDDSIKATSIEELSSYFSHFHEPQSLLRFNAVFNSLRIVDPAVGSGRFLVAALHELIVLKAELGILVDSDGQRIHQLCVSSVNNELVINNEDGEPFEYIPEGANLTKFSPVEMQRVQKTIVHEKLTLLENCLFGVDISSIAVNFCTLRLWIELIKSVPVTEATGKVDRRDIASLPCALNIKIGNALVSRFGLDFQADGLKSPIREKFLIDFNQYRMDALALRQNPEKPDEEQIHARIQEFAEFLNQVALAGQKEVLEIRRLEARLAQAALPFDSISQDDRQQKLTSHLQQKKAAYINKQRVFQQAVEWRFAFPDVLDETGNYAGFDAVIGVPPFTRPEGFPSSRAYFQGTFPNTYTSKADPYVLFVELGLNLLKPGGQLTYGLPTKWTQVGYASKLRNWLQTEAVEQKVAVSGLTNTDEKPAQLSVLSIRKVEE